MSHTVAYHKIEPRIAIEEETLRSYKAERYYPVNIGDTFQDRYRTIGKLGYGTASTVWLCHDLLQSKKYVALKVYVNVDKPIRELPVYNHINRLESQHGGRYHIREMLDSFTINGPHGQHTCLVHEALGMNLEELRDLLKELSPELVRSGLRDILQGVHFLHQEARIVHTDIQPKNMLMGILKSDTALTRFEQEEIEDPFPRKELPDRTIYVSRTMRLTKGTPSLSDLSEARFDDPGNTDLVMPGLYRAPEVVLNMPWSYPIDVWGFAMTLWDLLEPNKLFYPYDKEGRYSEALHLAQMIAIMGPPPLAFLQRSEESWQFWDSKGIWKDIVSIPEQTLQCKECRFHGKEQVAFLELMRKMLRWSPEDRCSLEDIYNDDWLLTDLIALGEVVRD